MEKIIVNKARCKKCGDIIESKYTHDFVTCSCGAISVDGGHSYLRRCYENREDLEDLSEVEEVEEPERKKVTDMSWEELKALFEDSIGDYE